MNVGDTVEYRGYEWVVIKVTGVHRPKVMIRRSPRDDETITVTVSRSKVTKV